MVSDRLGKRLRATEAIAGAVSDGRFLGVFAGVGSIPLRRVVLDRFASILLSLRGIGKPSAAAAEAVLLWSNAPETRRSRMVGDPFDILFFVVGGGDDGGGE